MTRGKEASMDSASAYNRTTKGEIKGESLKAKIEGGGEVIGSQRERYTPPSFREKMLASPAGVVQAFGQTTTSCHRGDHSKNRMRPNKPFPPPSLISPFLRTLFFFHLEKKKKKKHRDFIVILAHDRREKWVIVNFEDLSPSCFSWKIGFFFKVRGGGKRFFFFFPRYLRREALVLVMTHYGGEDSTRARKCTYANNRRPLWGDSFFYWLTISSWICMASFCNVFRLCPHVHPNVDIRGA